MLAAAARTEWDDAPPDAVEAALGATRKESSSPEASAGSGGQDSEASDPCWSMKGGDCAALPLPEAAGSAADAAGAGCCMAEADGWEGGGP